jgi:hypothetical protein
MSEIRNIPDAYLKARIATYKTYRKAGLDEQAEQVARVLKARHGFDVTELDAEKPAPEPEPEVEEKADEEAPETAVADPMPEAAVEPKPARRPGRPRTAGK